MTEYLKSILNAFHDLLFVFTADGTIEDYIATNHEDELILPKKEFIGKNHKEVLPPHVSKKLDQAFQKLNRGQEQYTFDYKIEVKGNPQWYNAVLSKIKNGDNPRYLGAVRNITVRKNQELFIRSILNTSPGGVMVLGAVRDYKDEIIDFKIDQVNQSVEFLTGASEEDLVGQRITTVVDKNVKKKMLTQFKAVVQSGAPLEFQYQHRDEKGEVIWYHSRAVKYQDGIVGTFMDITEQKKTEEKLAEKNEELQELNRQKDKLFSVISHDLRNAVAGAKLVYDVIFLDYEGLSKNEILEYLHLLNHRTNNIHELLEDLLAWSKNQSQKVTTDLEKLHLASLIDTTLDNVRSQADSKKIELLNQIPDTIYVHADANMIKTVLRNLITNGIKFSNPGGKVSINAERTNQKIKVSVRDDGIGMNKETQEKVMNRQTTFTSEGTSGEKGSGVGLDLCIDFVEIHGGEIWVESKPGQGCTFNFTLSEYS